MNELTDKKHFNYPNPLKNIVSLISSMMIKWILSYKIFIGLIAFMLSSPNFSSSQNLNIMTPFEKNNNQTATYDEVIDFYKKLAKNHKKIVSFKKAGMTDSGHPLHELVISLDGYFEPSKARKNNQTILFINNGIHPGEPEGIDATMMLLRDYLEDDKKAQELKGLVIVAIPVYNIDGCLRRNSYSRANQDGPESYGFRGNDRNLDLNRDFIKCDSRNAKSFNQLFSYWSPDFFVDNHTSNGADYQYTMTLIATQHNKLETQLGEFLQKKCLPFLYSDMEKKGWEMIPYVDSDGETPDSGILGFSDNPRYSTGYTAVHNVIGFMPETHMLKPFKDRLASTYEFMKTVIHFLQTDGREIATIKKAAETAVANQSKFALEWKLDKSKFEKIPFRGYEAKHKPSDVSGLPRLYYDRNAPYTKEIKYWNEFAPSIEIEKPLAYIIPQAYDNVIERLEWNGVKVQHLRQDIEIEVEKYKILDFKTTANAYEGHYLHSNIKVEKIVEKTKFRKGDFVIIPNQTTNKYIVETLEPQAPDSYFAWNFFDGILMQKEGFSAYVFEDLAAKFLAEHPEVKEKLDEKKKEDAKFAASAEAQLDWVYKHSPYYEPTHRIYPVGRLVSEVKLPLSK